MNEAEKIRLKILKAKLERKHPSYIQKLQQDLDKAVRGKKDGKL